MNKHQAEKIINEYGGVIAGTPKGDIVCNVFSLPYSPGRIRYAYFIYTEAPIKEGSFNDDIKNNLETTYAMLGTRFVEDHQKVNKAFKLYAKNKKAREYLDYRGGLTAFMPSLGKMTEYNNFVVDCYGHWVQAD